MGGVLKLLTLLLISLQAIAQKEKHYPVLKQPFVKPEGLATNGVYVQMGKVKWSITHAIYLYDDGTYFSSSIHNSYLELKGQAFVDSLVSIDVDKRWGSFGFYRINEDTLITQHAHKNSNIESWQVYEERFRISNGQLYPLTFRNYYPNNERKASFKSKTDTAAFIFYPTTIKPGLQRATFYDVDWYQKYK